MPCAESAREAFIVKILFVMAKRTRRKKTNIFTDSKIEIWRNFVACGGRVGEVARRYNLQPEEVEKVVNEVEEFFHAPLHDPQALLRQFSLLNEAAAHGEMLLFEIISYYYDKWRQQGGEKESPPEPLYSLIPHWHGLILSRMKIQAKLLTDLKRELARIQQEDDETRQITALLQDTDEDSEEEGGD